MSRRLFLSIELIFSLITELFTVVNLNLTSIVTLSLMFSTLGWFLNLSIILEILSSSGLRQYSVLNPLIFK